MKGWSPESFRFVRTLAAETGRAIVSNATVEGMRRSLDWVDDMVLRGILDELDARGVSRKVAADMLGITPRTLRRQVAAQQEARQDEEATTIWVQIIDLLLTVPMTRGEVEGQFPHIEPERIGGILHDMKEEGWLRVEAGKLVAETAPNDINDEELDSWIRARVELVDLSPKLGELTSWFGLDRARLLESLGRIGYSRQVRWYGERAEGEIKYLGMMMIARAFMRLMRRTPENSGGVWMVEVTDWDDETRDELQREIGDIERQCHELFAKYDALNLDKESPEREGEFIYWALTLGKGPNLKDDLGGRRTNSSSPTNSGDP